MAVTIGADPEVFVTDGEKIISGIGLIGGTKEEPRETASGAVQEDNVLAEFNIEPASTPEDFVQHINKVVGELKDILAPKGIAVVSSHEFEEEALIEGGMQALVFGCDPDLNCWDMEQNEAPDCMSTLRTAGGHVHIGYDQPDPAISFRIARMCDVFLGIPSILIDNDTRRRELYGKAGACRIKAYGIEYRSLSNFWLKVSTVTEWVFNQAKYCAENTDRLESILDYIDGTEIQRIINEGDQQKAAEVVDALNIPMPRFENAS